MSAERPLDRHVWGMLDKRAFVAPTVDRLKTSSLEALLEHYDERKPPPALFASGNLAHLSGIPIDVDATVEPGIVEAWLNGELVGRYRIA